MTLLDEEKKWLKDIRDGSGAELMYAEWLDEHCDEGQPGYPPVTSGHKAMHDKFLGGAQSAKASYIRLAVDCAKPLEPQQPDETAEAYEQRKAERMAMVDCSHLLLNSYRADWEKPLKDEFGRDIELAYHLGLPDFLACRTELMASDLEDILAACPSIIELKSTDYRRTMEANNLPFLVHGDQPPVDLANGRLERITAIAECPSMRQIRALDLTSSYVMNDGAEALAQSPHCANLERLMLADNQLGDAGVISIARSPYLHNLRELDLRDNNFGDEAAEALAANPHFANLRSLRLSDGFQSPVYQQMTARGIQALADSEHFRPDMRISFQRFEGRFDEFQEYWRVMQGVFQADDQRRGRG